MVNFMGRVLRLMDQKGVRASEVCKAIGVKDPSFHAWKKGTARITITNRQKLAKYLGTTVEYLETGIHPKMFEVAPIVRTTDDLAAFAVTLKESIYNPVLQSLAKQSQLEPAKAVEIFNQLEKSQCANTSRKPGTFVWVVENASMVAPVGISFPKGAQVLIDPRRKPEHDQCILILHEGYISLRAWSAIQGTHLLTLLNPVYSQASAINYSGNIWDIWLGTPVSYTLSV